MKTFSLTPTKWTSPGGRPRLRPMLLLASGLGGGSQDTYVRSMAATAAERGWQVKF